ncbi:DNA-3-methyladenine glycosylase 2 family protein [Micromonospora sp. PPF5-17]|uniref:DNA-3-methyladenine glycosylase II n=1 Tax=Micromonospora solifontis TaxID=2487138 RepID=A0ABX9WIE3_9ACTN|nr:MULTISPECIES: AlkA N-terminal domain-containing protein [Micromonospora]NES15316.1 DNA-3-methyladenine glycosylase 2 family protein [Micromonospora sp. PPF5-17B]NES36107.1 DNA-3-methyladenine glycosylase 2 family protein [Micromonospora solifontis]NES56664.1 DNA-3-methyladenine glycosylase 2 family protein [Micromonospora sp. PPF5-6]RNL99865.1 DNA-3-methyladenine glycosylase 2 family protein [Micromonospora solifontis]
MELDFERCYRAVDSRDQRFDGWFYTGVTSTGIYCRPSCPAMTPKRQNVRFFPSAAAAQGAGLRACRRCRPDAAPGSPQWDVRADVVGRAMRLIADGVVDRDGVPGLAARLGYTERHLHRMLHAELGAGPLALARAQRAQTARILIETTGLGMAEIAFAAGFGSVRQFNDTVREVYGAAPSDLRVTRGGRPVAGGAGTISLRLAYRPPLHAAALLDFLAVRALPGVEEVRDGTYRRGVRLPHGAGSIALTPADGYVAATLRLTDLRDLSPAVARCRRLLDLDADPVAIDATLAGDPALAAAVGAEPGVRLPHAVDGFEMAVRAITTQQISLASARTTLTHLLTATGPGRSVDHEVDGEVDLRNSSQLHDRRELAAFPGAEEVAGLPDSAFRMPAARRETLRGLARAVAEGELDLEPGGDREETVRRLVALPGIGPWTAGYVAMRALGDPDVLLPTDLGVRRGATALGLAGGPKTLNTYADRWRPWRSYAVIRLWRAA